jgi:hypothetical protein
MKKTLAFATALAAVLATGSLWAQEPAEEEPQPQEEARPEPTHRIKVLHNPYDLASFYRSHQERRWFGLGDSEGTALGNPYEDPYSIAGYYRSRQGSSPYGYSAFWTGGYSGPNRGVAMGFRRRIGQNGDLFLLVPTVLAPVGPLTGVFLDPR